MSLILGIESSCDECSASVVRYHPQLDGPSHLEVLSVSTFSQIELHRPYGGVVPEIASRNHLETINLRIDEALLQAQILPKQLDAIAVTNRPGLVGALLVGVSAAKAMAYALRLPLVPVHHLEGHATSIYLDPPADFAPELPLLLAVVSGGHTQLYVMKTHPELWTPDFLKKACVARSRDDAAGEAFDKTAKTLGFPYPGGVWIDRRSEGGLRDRYDFPRALPQKDILDFSFSGLKTAVSLTVQKLKKEGRLDAEIANICASLQEAIIDALLAKMTLAIRNFGIRGLAIVGGVAANSRLRERLSLDWKKMGLSQEPIFPHLKYCTDNAAMIAGAGAYRWRQGHALTPQAALTLNAVANPEV